MKASAEEWAVRLLNFGEMPRSDARVDGPKELRPGDFVPKKHLFGMPSESLPGRIFRAITE